MTIPVKRVLALELLLSILLIGCTKEAAALELETDPVLEAIVRDGGKCWTKGQWVYLLDERCGRGYLKKFDERHPLGKRMAGLETLAVLATDPDPKVFEAVMWLLEKRYFPYDTPVPLVYKEASSMSTRVPGTVAERFARAARRIPGGHDWNHIYPTMVHVAVLSGADDALVANVKSMVYHRKRLEMTRRLLVFGLDRFLDLVRAEVRKGFKAAFNSDDNVHGMLLLASLEHLPALSPAHREAICPWMKELVRHRDEYVVEHAGSALMACGGEYPDAFRAVIRSRHFQRGDVIGALERACSQKGFADDQCALSLPVLRRLALDRRSGADARASAAMGYVFYAPLAKAESLVAKLGSSLPAEDLEELKAELGYRKRKKD